MLQQQNNQKDVVKEKTKHQTTVSGYENNSQVVEILMPLRT
jgi:hypothetical protein